LFVAGTAGIFVASTAGVTVSKFVAGAGAVGAVAGLVGTVAGGVTPADGPLLAFSMAFWNST
jgi:hypothetical protein